MTYSFIYIYVIGWFLFLSILILPINYTGSVVSTKDYIAADPSTLFTFDHNLEHTNDNLTKSEIIAVHNFSNATQTK